MNLLDAQEFSFHMDCNIICGSFTFDYTGKAAKPDFLRICPVGLKECVIIFVSHSSSLRSCLLHLLSFILTWLSVALTQDRLSSGTTEVTDALLSRGRLSLLRLTRYVMFTHHTGNEAKQ